jgi:hypothetical protein
MKHKPLLLFLCLALSATSCSHFSASGRQQHAYAQQMKKVEKQRKRHQKAQLEARRKSLKNLPPTPPTSDLQVSTMVEPTAE